MQVLNVATRAASRHRTFRIASSVTFGGLKLYNIYSPVTQICTIWWQTRLHVYIYICTIVLSLFYHWRYRFACGRKAKASSNKIIKKISTI